MRVLHYSLGFSPYRSGGMTRYVMDVLEEQRLRGYELAMLWPGRMKGKNPSIIKHCAVNQVESYELVNPLPVVLDKKIGDPASFHYPVEREVFEEFISRIRPSVIHIHTLQGLHREFIEAAREVGVRTFFTTHDFFGLYPMNAIYPMDHKLSDEECSLINEGAPSISELTRLQSAPIRIIKSSPFLRKVISAYCNSRKLKKEIEPRTATHEKEIIVKPYNRFREYEISILNNIDNILYNSTISKLAYTKYCSPRKTYTISITHNNIMQERTDREGYKSRHAGEEVVQIAYVGGSRPYKGLSLLIEVFERIDSESESGASSKFRLIVYGVQGQNKTNIEFRPAYTDFVSAMRDVDVVAVPSITYESFGFVVLEALALRKPVLVSDVVGAKDLLPSNYPSFKAGSVDELKRLITGIDEDWIDNARRIIEGIRIKDISEHVEELEEVYKC